MLCFLFIFYASECFIIIYLILKTFLFYGTIYEGLFPYYYIIFPRCAWFYKKKKWIKKHMNFMLFLKYLTFVCKWKQVLSFLNLNELNPKLSILSLACLLKSLKKCTTVFESSLYFDNLRRVFIILRNA